MEPRSVEFVCNSGIGDISWVLSKVLSIPKITQGEVQVTISACDGYPQRGHQLVELVSGVKWAGYRPISNERVYFQHTPSKWPAYWGLDPLTKLAQSNLTPCTFFEANGTLEEWMACSGLPTDYHYPINGVIPYLDVRNHPGYIAASVSSRHLNGTEEWHIWNPEEWFALLYRVALKTGIRKFTLIGAEYDRESAEAVGGMLSGHGMEVLYVIGYALETALKHITQCSYYFAYQSGLAVLANVLNAPCLTLLPRHLPNIAKSYADPVDLASGKYWGLCVPSVEEAAEWFESEGLRHVR